MSREGRRRLAASILRFTVAVIVIVGVLVGIWQVTHELRESPNTAPAAAAVPLGAPRLETDGFLGADPGWLARTLALPRGASLIGLDLDELRERLLTHSQVRTAVLTKIFPSSLRVRITERMPVARVMAQLANGEPQAFLVARDGVVFPGIGYEIAMLNSLPWLEPMKLARTANGFQAIEGMGAASDLIAKAQLEAEHLYSSWRVVSLARLNADAEIEVRTASGGTIVFSATTDYFTQLANLDLTLDRIAVQGASFKRINLANGRDVTVTLETPLLPSTSAISKSAPSTKTGAMPVGSKPSSPHTTAFGNFSTQPKKAP
ncbi:MAG: FtsQ-type POTRA domain-containing protein [Opitutaceae bacterium]|nr:FtsQ-type POTRA domain-containing protein [Opitutaceae bacterium]